MVHELVNHSAGDCRLSQGRRFFSGSSFRVAPLLPSLGWSLCVLPHPYENNHHANGCQSFLAATDLQAVGALCGGRQLPAPGVMTLRAFSMHRIRILATIGNCPAIRGAPQSHCNPLAGGAGVQSKFFPVCPAYPFKINAKFAVVFLAFNTQNL